MQRVLLFAATTGYQTRAFGDAAAHLGVELVLATDRCNVLDDPWQDRALPVRFEQEGASTETILLAAQTTRFDGVLAVGDRPTALAARAAAALRLPWHPPAATAAARNKRLTREHFRAAGLQVPWFDEPSLAIDPDALAESLPFPCVVKPLALSGSRGVMRVDTGAELRTALDRLHAMLRSSDILAERDPAHERILIEEFIPGREYAVEGLMHHGVLHVLAMFDKPDPLDGPFFEETIYVTPSRASAALQAEIAAAISAAAAALGLHHGPVHAECRAGSRGLFVLEVAARPIGGLCARSLRFVARDAGPGAAAIPFEELLLRHAIGESPAAWTREAPASGVMMIPIPRRGLFRRVEGLEAAAATPLVDDVRITAKTDQLLIPLPEGASYLGFIFAHAGTAADVEQALRAAHARLTFVIDPEVRVLQSAHG